MEPNNYEDIGHAIPLDDLIEHSRRLREQSDILEQRIAELNEQIDQLNGAPQLERLDKEAPKVNRDDMDGFAYEAK